MPKIDLNELHRTIGREEFDYPLLTSALSSYSAIDQKINELLKSGEIVRIKKVSVFGPKARQKQSAKKAWQT